MKFRYISDGESPPETVNYMGRYEFELNGEPVDVTNPAVLAKIVGNASFEQVEAADAPVVAKKLGRPKKVKA